MNLSSPLLPILRSPLRRSERQTTHLILRKLLGNSVQVTPFTTSKIEIDYPTFVQPNARVNKI